MPDKLTDSEIVKALEYWREFDKEIDQMLNGRFKGDKMLLEQKEIVKITLNLFDLINRLQAEKQNLEVELQAMRGAANSYKAENERLKADCENYKQVAENQQRVTLDRGFEIKRLKEEIERLKPFEDKIAEFNSHIRVEDMLVFTSSLEEWLEFCNNLKSEVYTDFAESLKKDFDNPHIQKFGLDFVKFLKNVVDNRLKEMKGE